MTQEQLEQLKDLVRDWRKQHYGTGDPSYDNGLQTARDSCADALEELIED